MGRRREGPRVDPATIAGVVAPVGWRRAGSSSPHLRAFAIGLARRPSAQRRVRARFVEAGTTLRKFLWDNDLATRAGRVYHMVCPKVVSRVTRWVSVCGRVGESEALRRTDLLDMGGLKLDQLISSLEGCKNRFTRFIRPPPLNSSPRSPAGTPE